MMTEDINFEAFVREYRRLRLGSMDFEFVLGWRPKLEEKAFQVGELLLAILEVTADRRAGFPLNDLPLLIEHAETIRQKNSKAQVLRPWGPRPPFTEFWDSKMLENGVIDEQEFNRRQAERKGSAA